jgi:hypothetical protein
MSLFLGFLFAKKLQNGKQNDIGDNKLGNISEWIAERPWRLFLEYDLVYR